MKQFKQMTGFRYRQATGSFLWQEGYYDHVLRDDDATIDKAHYILANPVRAGLALTPRDYPGCGSGVYSIDELLDAIRDSRT